METHFPVLAAFILLETGVKLVSFLKLNEVSVSFCVNFMFRLKSNINQLLSRIKASAVGLTASIAKYTIINNNLINIHVPVNI